MTPTITKLKQEAYEHFIKLSPEERLLKACWNEPYFNLKPSDKYGILFWTGCRIWIDHNGKIYKNKPKG